MQARDCPKRSRAESARAGASLPRMLLFGVGGRVYGCEIEVVREIVPFRRCTRLPGAPPFVCGPVSYTHLTLPTKRIV